MQDFHPLALVLMTMMMMMMMMMMINGANIRLASNSATVDYAYLIWCCSPMDVRAKDT